MDGTLHRMSVPVLAERCKRELDNYRRGEPSNDQYGLELFSRAVIQRDTLAWEAIQQSFNTLVRHWMRSHPLRDIARRYDSEENFVAQAFSRFWQAAADQQIAFQTMGAAMNYLRMSLHGTIVDTLRKYASARLTALSENDEVGELCAEDQYDTNELWQVICNLLPDKRERRVAYLLYHCGLKPREIMRFCSQEFDDVQEIYRIRRNLIERLRTNTDYLRWHIA